MIFRNYLAPNKKCTRNLHFPLLTISVSVRTIDKTSSANIPSLTVNFLIFLTIASMAPAIHRQWIKLPHDTSLI